MDDNGTQRNQIFVTGFRIKIEKYIKDKILNIIWN